MFLRTSNNPSGDECLITTLHPKITRVLAFPHLFRIVLQGYLRGCLQATVLSKTQKKLNSQVFLCVFFSYSDMLCFLSLCIFYKYFLGVCVLSHFGSV